MERSDSRYALREGFFRSHPLNRIFLAASPGTQRASQVPVRFSLRMPRAGDPGEVSGCRPLRILVAGFR